jgi:hypothetical protein
MGSTSAEPNKFYTKPQQPTTGCHMAAHDWATWHINHQPESAKCQMLDGPRAYHLSEAILPSHLAMSALSRQLLMSSSATCHPYSGDTCHHWIGPTVCPYAKSACHMSPPGAAMCHLLRFPHHLYGPYALYSQHATWTVRTVQSSPFYLFGFLDRTRYLLHTEPV